MHHLPPPLHPYLYSKRSHSPGRSKDQNPVEMRRNAGRQWYDECVSVSCAVVVAQTLLSLGLMSNALRALKSVKFTAVQGSV